MRIAIAKDRAFNFTYRENIDRLREMGEVTFFSPLAGDELPEADLVYLPGGYPELFAPELSLNRMLASQLVQYAERGGRIFAECGGMMWPECCQLSAPWRAPACTWVTVALR